MKLGEQGWVPPQERTTEQQLQQEEWQEWIGCFSDHGEAVEIPETALLYDLEERANESLTWRPWQQTGSCVGVSAARAYTQAACGDIVHRGEWESPEFVFPFASYGYGRQLAGMRGRGSGSYGSAQAKSVLTFGRLPWSDANVPKPTIRSGWAIWTREQELNWSHPSAWPVDVESVKETAGQYLITSVVRIDSTDEAKQLLAQGYGVTLASNFGTSPRVEGEYLIGRWNDNWAHQMSCSGYTKFGSDTIFAIDNQWGPNGHGGRQCPTLAARGIKGSFWIREGTFGRIIDSGEVFGHSATHGFPVQRFDWGRMGYPPEEEPEDVSE
jgi:hypothetical protein